MSAVKLPSAGSLQESRNPLLGEDAQDAPLVLPRPRRRCAKCAFVLLPLLLIGALIVLSSPRIPKLDPLEERIQSLVTSKGEEAVLEVGVPQEEVRWSEEDKRLRKYSWTAPEPHESLTKMLEDLTPAQNRTREWLLRTRPRSQGATGIGLGASEPPENIRPAPRALAHKSLPRAYEGPGLFVNGSFDKYSNLLREWQTGRPADVCEKGAWEDEYTALHAEMMRGEREPSLLEFVCHAGEYCGGFADRYSAPSLLLPRRTLMFSPIRRVLGMVTTFLYSILTKRAFSITWEQPAPFDLLFDSPYIDWSRPFNPNSTTPPRRVYANETLVEARKEIEAHNWEEPQIDDFFPGFVGNYSDGKTIPWLRFDFNRGVVLRSFTYPDVAPLVHSLGFTVTTAYSCLLNYLVRPKAAVLAFIAQYTSFFSLPENFVIGLQIRTGDVSMYASRKDAINSVSHHAQYFACADAVARTYAHPTQKIVYYLISDSRVLEEDALRTYPDRVVVTGLKQSHVEIATGSVGWKGLKGAADGFMRTVAESWIFSGMASSPSSHRDRAERVELLAGTDFQILTLRSGFGKIRTPSPSSHRSSLLLRLTALASGTATWLRGRQGTTIQIFNPYIDPDYTRAVKKKNKGVLPPPLDCSFDTALKSFSELAQDWSLG
ncbi:SPOSA6832_00603 [Sporobolomyces salmonicolor]|uniref:SPOSA6832_00603-mRNA-1:cds n=1 Tax=Sporidiobolus salmonicolor TaxID=5005 RepID=A0A0D6EH35_SPOSA|nr:SPOSA6832_00603 [Sporobolomyces salmonicolor]